MPRPISGTILERPWRDGHTVTFALRVPFNGRRPIVTLGTNHEGWNRERAQVELDRILEQIRRGTWEPPAEKPGPQAPTAPEPEQETIHFTLSRWWTQHKKRLSDNTLADYEWRMAHILRFRPHTPTAEIDEMWVDELRDHLAKQPARNRTKGSKKKLSHRSVNMVLDVLAMALDLAVRYKLLVGNPARTKGTKLPVEGSPRSFLEPEMVIDLLDEASAWEAELEKRKRPDQCFGRRELVALLCLAGPRIEEAVAGDRGEFDLAGDHWRIPDSKTEAGQRTVELTVFCAEEQRSHVAASPARGRPITARKPMYPTANGTAMGQGNVRRMLRQLVARTNDRREAADKMLLPVVTPHTLRRTFASLCFFAGRDPAWVMGQMGHTDPRLTLRVYAQTMQRKNIDRELVWKLMRFADEPEEWPGFSHRNGHMAAENLSEGDAKVRGA